MLRCGTSVASAEEFPSLATAKPLINAMVSAPVHLFQGTGAEVKFLTQLTCSLKDNMVNRPVLGHGVTGVSCATNIFHPGLAALSG